MYTLEEWMDQVKKVPVHIILEHVWPNGLCLFRDNGWFAFWEGDTEGTEYDMETNESFEEFIWRAMANELFKEEPDEQGYCLYAVDFAIAQADFVTT